jgi:predicted nucleic acid-binding protein
VYLIDTNVISEARKRAKANRGVRRFFDEVSTHDEPLFVSVITVGEIRRGVEIVAIVRITRRRGVWKLG